MTRAAGGGGNPTWDTDPAAIRKAAAQVGKQYGHGAGAELLKIARAYPYLPLVDLYSLLGVWLVEKGIGGSAAGGANALAHVVQTAGNALPGSLPASPLSGWGLQIGNTAGLLGRILKVGFGAVLIISGVVHLTGADNAVVQRLKQMKMVIPA